VLASLYEKPKITGQFHGVELLPKRHAGIILFQEKLSYSASDPVRKVKMHPTLRVPVDHALQSDLLRAIRRHRRTAEDYYTRELKRAEIGRLSPFFVPNPAKHPLCMVSEPAVNPTDL